MRRGAVCGGMVTHNPFRRFVLPTSLGPVLIECSGRGISRLIFAGPDAEPCQADGNAGAWALAAARAVDQPRHAADLPLDLLGTPFQLAVWAELRRIPAGETRSYAAIAAAIGRPGAVRAVGAACAANPVMVLVPCHRALRSDGALGGYAFGLERKRKLLEAEGALVQGRLGLQ